MKLKTNIKQKRLKISNNIVVTLILLIITIIFCFKIINKKIKQILLNIAESETKKLATLVINDAVSKQLASNLTVDNLFNMTTDNNGNITSIDFNSVIVNKV